MWSLRPKLSKFDQEGTVFGAINRGAFENLVVIDPPYEFLSATEVVLSEIEHRMQRNECPVSLLSAIRDGLLLPLVSGRFKAECLSHAQESEY